MGSREQVVDLAEEMSLVSEAQSIWVKVKPEGGEGAVAAVGGGGSSIGGVDKERVWYMLVILVWKNSRKELQSDVEPDVVLLSGGLRSLLTVEKRVRGFPLEFWIMLE